MNENGPWISKMKIGFTCHALETRNDCKRFEAWASVLLYERQAAKKSVFSQFFENILLFYEDLGSMPAKRHPEAFFFIHKPGILLLSNPLICPRTGWLGESGKAQKILPLIPS